MKDDLVRQVMAAGLGITCAGRLKVGRVPGLRLIVFQLENAMPVPIVLSPDLARQIAAALLNSVARLDSEN